MKDEIMEKLFILLRDREFWGIIIFIFLVGVRIKYVRWFRRYGDEFKPRDKRHPLNIIGRIVQSVFGLLLILALIFKIFVIL